jgi:hypothetical protein
MKLFKIVAITVTVIISASSAFAVGGILSDGQGTNWSYGNIYGQGLYSLIDFATVNVNGSGITNIPSAGIVSLNANKLEAGTILPAVDGSAVTNVNASELKSGTIPNARISNLPASSLAAGTVASAIDGSFITNLASDGITSLDASKLIAGSTASAINGVNITNVTAAAPGDMLSTNSSAQSKAGLLTLNGGATIAGNVIYTPSAVQAIATGAAIAANAAVVKVVGDGGAVTATIADGTTEGQVLKIIGTDAVNTVNLTNAAVVPNFMLGTNDVIQFQWSGSVWNEDYRRDN